MAVVVDVVLLQQGCIVNGVDFQVGPLDMEVTPVGGTTRSDHKADVVEMRTAV